MASHESSNIGAFLSTVNLGRAEPTPAPSDAPDLESVGKAIMNTLSAGPMSVAGVIERTGLPEGLCRLGVEYLQQHEMIESRPVDAAGEPLIELNAFAREAMGVFALA